MSKEIMLFLNGIASSLNPDGYHNVVTSPKKLGEISTKIYKKRERNQKRISKAVELKYEQYAS